MSKQRVVVIGAGVLGLFTARELLQHSDIEVTVLDKAHPGDGSSGRSVGMVETQYFTRPTVEVRAYGREHYAKLEQEGLTFTHGGYLRLARTEADMESFRESIAIQREFGIEDAEILSADDIVTRWPQIITEGLIGGLLGTWDGFVDGFEVCQNLAAWVRSQGGTVKTGQEVTGATRDGDVWRITTAAGEYEADVVVNAAGPHAGVIGEMLGAPVPLLPMLHGAVTVRVPEFETPTPFVMDYIPGSGVDGVYFRSEGTQHLIAGLHTEEVIGDAVSPDVLLRSVGDDVLERIVELLAERLSNADDLELDRSWQGIYPMTPDHQPIVGVHPAASGVVCALGAGGSGIQLSPSIGRLAADAVRGITEPAFEIAPEWDAARFTESA
ncbi:MAG: FAD-binding oxidoreductase [Salinibacterium sp.]|nr:FAD-binding oxidoreductase [Salinibacterium sp.]MBF0672152.1 FAD-binding oxidoreductase [Salinibacterium sp.]